MFTDEQFPQPIISVLSSGGGASEGGAPQVSTGSSFTIRCSAQPRFPGGSFQLLFTSPRSSPRSSPRYTQPAVNHAADFLFPAAEPAHQGSYSCVYSVNVSSRLFSISSPTLSLSGESLEPLPV